MLEKIKTLLFEVHSDEKRKITKNFAWLTIAQVGSRFAKALVTLVAARFLGAEGYGVFSYVFGLAGFFIFFKNIGIDSLLTREIAKKRENGSTYISTSLWIEFALLAITAVLVIWVAPLFSNITEALPLLSIVALILIFDDLRDMSVAFFRGRERMELEALVVVTGNLAVAGFGIAALLISPTPFSFTIAYAAASVLGWGISVFFFKKIVGNLLRNFDRKLIRPILRSAWPIAIGGAVSVFLFNVDMVMLGWWRSVGEIGLYGAVQRVVGILAIFSSLFSISIFPFLARVAEESEERKKAAMENAMAILFLVALPLVFGGWAVGGDLVRFLFGQDFQGGTLSFLILLPSILATFPLAVLINFIFAHDKQIKVIPFAFIAAITNVLLNFFLIRKFGIHGAAVATLAANFVYVFLLWNYAKTIVHFSTFNQFPKMVFASVLVGACALLLGNAGVHVLLNIFFSSALYFTVLYAIKEKTFRFVFSYLIHK